MTALLTPLRPLSLLWIRGSCCSRTVEIRKSTHRRNEKHLLQRSPNFESRGVSGVSWCPSIAHIGQKLRISLDKVVSPSPNTHYLLIHSVQGEVSLMLVGGSSGLLPLRLTHHHPSQPICDINTHRYSSVLHITALSGINRVSGHSGART